MSDHDFVSIGIPVGTARLTISATSVASMVGFLNDLNEDDPVEGTSPIGDVLDHVNTINAAVALKMPTQAPQPARMTSPDGGFTPPMPDNQGGATPAPNCNHGPMKFKSGVTKSGQNAGRQYQGHFCPAPYGQQQCKPQNFQYLS